MQMDNPADLIEERNVFDPVLLPDAANEFIYEHIGTPAHLVIEEIPMVNRDGRHVPEFNPNVAQRILERFIELEQEAEHKGLAWVGPGAVRACVRHWIDNYRKRWEQVRKANPHAGHPSMGHLTQTGEVIHGARGSDSGRVRTWQDRHGNRHPFALDLTPERRATAVRSDWAVMDDDAVAELQAALRGDDISALAQDEAEIMAQEAAEAERQLEQLEGEDETVHGEGQGVETNGGPDRLPNDLHVDRDKGVIDCTVKDCNFREQWDTDSAKGEQMAMLRMRAHLKNPKREKGAHSNLYHEVFGADSG